MEKYSQQEAQYFTATPDVKQEDDEMLNDQTINIEPDDESTILNINAKGLEQGAWSYELKN